MQQPVYVEDVADAVVDAVLSEKTLAKAYNIAGSTPLTFNQVIDTICNLLGRRVFKIHIPALPVVAILGFFERFGLRLPIKAEQILRLNEDKAFGVKDAAGDFGYAPLSFAEGIALELEEMGLRPLKAL